MPNLLSSTLASTLAAALLLATAAAAAEPDWSAANLAAVDDHILPRYRQLEAGTALLDERLQALCTAPDPAALDAAREGFHAAMDAWQGIQQIRFGPVDRFLRHHRYQLWPDKHNTGSKQLGQLLAGRDREVLAPERFRHTSVAVQGLGALERLLFDGDAAAFATDDGYRCRLGEAIAINLKRMSTAIVAEWSGGDTPYREVIASAADGNDEFDSEREVTARLLNNLHTQLQAIVDQKLARPLGEVGEAGGKTNPRRAESWRSRRSLENIALNLAAAEELYRVAFVPLLEESDSAHQADREIQAAFAVARAAGAAINRPLFEIARDPAARPALERLRQATADLRRTVAERLPAAIGIPLGFNSLDGD